MDAVEYLRQKRAARTKGPLEEESSSEERERVLPLEETEIPPDKDGELCTFEVTGEILDGELHVQEVRYKDEDEKPPIVRSAVTPSPG